MPKTLSSAIEQLTDLQSRVGELEPFEGLAQAETDRANAAEAARDEAVTAMNAAVERANSATSASEQQAAEFSRVSAELEIATAERASLGARIAESEATIERLEALCGVRGIDPAAAVPAVAGDTGADRRSELLEQLSKEKDPRRRNELAKALRTA